MSDNVKNLGWRVTLAGTAINLALGILYTWSVISKAIPEEWGWNEAERALPYSVAIIVFALTMVVAGKLQDKFGPRWVALAGGISVGIGMILASRTTSVIGFVIGFGVLTGAGIGMGYASATPPAIKWFPAKKTGMIAGIVVSGFGLASLWIAPLAKYLIDSFGVQNTMLIFGIAFLIVVSILSQLLINPPSSYKPQAVQTQSSTPVANPAPAKTDYSLSEMLKTPHFYTLWIMYAFAAGAGLMIIGKLAKIVDVQSGVKAGFVYVAILAIGNAAGRIIAGSLSDKIGRTLTMSIVFIFQAVLMFILRFINSAELFVPIAFLLGFNYGSNLSLFPSATKDYFGLKNFGVNYGAVFTAWGVGGFVMPIISGRVFDAAHNFNLAYVTAGVCLILAAVLSQFVKAPKRGGH